VILELKGEDGVIQKDGEPILIIECKVEEEC
jgi:hypothetical protein